AGLAAEPAAVDEVVGQHQLEVLVAGWTEQLGPVACQRELWHDVLLENDFGTLAAQPGRHGQREPGEAIRPDRQQIRRLAKRREGVMPEALGWYAPRERGEAQLAVLHDPRQVGDDKDALVLTPPQKGEDLAVLGLEELKGTATERLEAFAQGDEAL